MTDIVDPFEQSSPPSGGGIVDPFDSMPHTKAPPDEGALAAGVRGALQGATFNFSDEMAGLRGASGLSDEFKAAVPYSGEIVGGVRKLLGSEGADKGYNEALERERTANTAAQSKHPYAYGAGEIAGAVPGMAVMPELGAARYVGPASNLLRGAITGGEYGALSGFGEGEGLKGRTAGAVEGGISGVIGGGLAGGVTDIVGALAKPLAGAYRAWKDPEGEASRRLVTALRADQELMAPGDRPIEICDGGTVRKDLLA